MAAIYNGPYKWSMNRDTDGYRTYRITHRVYTTDANDGPYEVSNTPGLPLPGSVWAFLNDFDGDVYATKELVITQDPAGGEGEKNISWFVDQVFTNRPNDTSTQECEDFQPLSPLDIPAKISGGFVKYTEEATHDRFGDPIHNSAFEQFRGPANEWDKGRPVIEIEQNWPTLDFALLCAMIDSVNADPMWGLPERTIKLSEITWQEIRQGNCECYYRRLFKFEINFDTWDRELLDEGTKVLNGQWTEAGEWQTLQIGGDDPDPNNPSHFIRFKDRNDENTRVILNGAGLPAEVDIDVGPGTTLTEIGYITIEKYYETDFFLLGIPIMFCNPGQGHDIILRQGGVVALQASPGG